MSMLFSGRYPAGASSVPLARHDVIDALTAAEFTDPDLHSRVALTLSEATGNVACHAYPHGGNEYMEVVVNETAGTVMIAVTDYGVGMNSTRVGLPAWASDCQRCAPKPPASRSAQTPTAPSSRSTSRRPIQVPPTSFGLMCRPTAGASRQWCCYLDRDSRSGCKRVEPTASGSTRMASRPRRRKR